MGRTQLAQGMHNLGEGLSRESEGLIVALKHGNACGAKGPYHDNALNKNNGCRLRMVTTECKVQCMRTKLANKAKQEPKFRFYNLYGHILRIRRSQRFCHPPEGMSYYGLFMKLGLRYL